MWQRSHEIICLYISSKPAKGLWEKSGILGYIDSLWLLTGLKTRGQATAEKIQLEELLVPGKGTRPPVSEVCPLSTSLVVLHLSRILSGQEAGDICRSDIRSEAQPGGTEGRGSTWVGKSPPASVLPCPSQ